MRESSKWRLDQLTENSHQQNLFGDLPDQEIDDLAASMAEEGLHHALEILSDGTIIDGAKPTVEIAFHAGIMRARPDVSVVMHFQTPCATTLACQHGSAFRGDGAGLLRELAAILEKEQRDVLTSQGLL